MKSRKASTKELVQYHQIMLGEAKKRLKAAQKAVNRTKDEIQHHQRTLRYLAQPSLFDEGDTK